MTPVIYLYLSFPSVRPRPYSGSSYASLRHLHHRHQSTMVHLPSELWQEILEYATFVFGELEEQIYDPFCCPPVHELELAIKGSQFSRYNFIHVSRTFYMLSIPYLYRTILVDGPIWWKRLEDCLTVNKRRVGNQPDTPLNTSFIKRIHFMTAWALNRALDGEQIDLPNLTICISTKANIVAYESETRHPFCMRFKAPQLRALEGVFETASNCLHAAAHFPFLTSCFYTTPFSIPLLRPPPYDGSSIRLEATTIGREWPFHQDLHLDLASLRAIKIATYTTNFSSLYAIGHQMQFLDIANSHLYHPNRDISIELSNLPALVTLIIDIAILGYKWHLPDGHAHSSLKRVGFIVPSKQQRHSVYRDHFDKFDGYRFPALEQLRILEMPVCRRLAAQNPGRVANWSDELGSRGVRLEAADGSLLAHLPTTATYPPYGHRYLP